MAGFFVILLAGCTQELSPQEQKHLRPYVNPYNFSFNGLKFGEKPRGTMDKDKKYLWHLSVHSENYFPQLGKGKNERFSTLLTFRPKKIQYYYGMNLLYKFEVNFPEKHGCKPAESLVSEILEYKALLLNAYSFEASVKNGSISDEERQGNGLKQFGHTLNELAYSDINFGVLAEYGKEKIFLEEQADSIKSPHNRMFNYRFEPTLEESKYATLKEDLIKFNAIRHNTDSAYPRTYMNKRVSVVVDCADKTTLTFNDLSLSPQYFNRIEENFHKQKG